MSQGEIVCDPTEAGAVKDIFARYLQGDSMQRIAETMEAQGTRYHERTKRWNKNMVKRVLENPHYLGDDQHPSIISEKNFQAVQKRKTANNIYAPCGVSSEIRKKTVCGYCGARMIRAIKNRKTSRWECENPDCGNTIHIADEQFNVAIYTLLETLAHTPEALAARIPIQQKQGGNAQRIANELTNALNRGAESVDYLRTLVFACAAERYNELPDSSFQYKTDKLRQRLESGDRGEAIQQELLNTAVRSIRITDPDTIALELVNGQLIGKKADA
jgi:hypothetical protein